MIDSTILSHLTILYSLSIYYHLQTHHQKSKSNLEFFRQAYIYPVIKPLLISVLQLFFFCSWLSHKISIILYGLTHSNMTAHRTVDLIVYLLKGFRT